MKGFGLQREPRALRAKFERGPRKTTVERCNASSPTVQMGDYLCSHCACLIVRPSVRSFVRSALNVFRLNRLSALVEKHCKLHYNQVKASNEVNFVLVLFHIAHSLNHIILIQP